MLVSSIKADVGLQGDEDESMETQSLNLNQNHRMDPTILGSTGALTRTTFMDLDWSRTRGEALTGPVS